MTRGWGNAELLVEVPESVTWNVGSGLDIVDLVQSSTDTEVFVVSRLQAKDGGNIR